MPIFSSEEDLREQARQNEKGLVGEEEDTPERQGRMRLLLCGALSLAAIGIIAMIINCCQPPTRQERLEKKLEATRGVRHQVQGGKKSQQANTAKGSSTSPTNTSNARRVGKSANNKTDQNGGLLYPKNRKQIWLKREVPLEWSSEDLCPYMKDVFWQVLSICFVIILLYFFWDCSRCFGEGGLFDCCGEDVFLMVGFWTLLAMPFVAAIVCGACYAKCCIRTKFETFGDRMVEYDADDPRSLRNQNPGAFEQYDEAIRLEKWEKAQLNPPKKPEEPKDQKNPEENKDAKKQD